MSKNKPMQVFITLLLIIGCSNALASLSKAQMLADFDQAMHFIDDFAVHKDLNAIRLGINYDNEYRKLRNQIDDNTTECEFFKLFERALNLVQDQHASTMSYQYLTQYAQYQKKYNFDDTTDFQPMQQFAVRCQPEKATLELPVMYSQGKYLVYADFSYQGKQITQGSEITGYNSMSIESFIRDNLDTVWPVKLNQKTGALYNIRFYQFGAADFTLSVNGKTQLQMNLYQKVDMATPPQRKIGYFSQKEPRVIYFDEQKILYIGLPMMNYEYVSTINQQIDKVVNSGQSIDNVAIDIRGNPGGNDNTWRDVIAHLMKKPLSMTLNLKMKHNKRTIDYYAEKGQVDSQSIALLNNQRYWTQNNNRLTLQDNADSIDFEGTIYLLQDQYIYSSAGNFSNFALSDNQIVSVGTPTDLVGGGQLEPLFFQLDQSKIIFRLEPALDFMNVSQLSDFSHNQIEVRLEPEVDDYFIRSTFEGDIYDRWFLINHDPLFQYVLKQL